MWCPIKNFLSILKIYKYRAGTIIFLIKAMSGIGFDSIFALVE